METVQLCVYVCCVCVFVCVCYVCVCGAISGEKAVQFTLANSIISGTYIGEEIDGEVGCLSIGEERLDNYSKVTVVFLRVEASNLLSGKGRRYGNKVYDGSMAPTYCNHLFIVLSYEIL